MSVETIGYITPVDMPRQRTDGIIDSVPRDPQLSYVQPGPSHLIDQMPSQTELAAGLDYSGEAGEFKPSNELLKGIQEIDPTAKLADPRYRSELIASADTEHAVGALSWINEKLYDHQGNAAISASEIKLGSGEGENKKVSFIGIAPEYRQEVLSAGLDGVQKLMSHGEPYAAGMLAAGVVVGLQMFVDGNKRTARALQELLTYGADPTSHYDVTSVRNRTSFTHKARASMYYEAATASNVNAFHEEHMTPTQRKTFESASLNWSEVNDRASMKEALTQIRDSDLTNNLIDVLQQTGFGTQYVLERADPALIAEYTEGRSTDTLKQIVRSVAEQLTTEDAQGIIDKDKVNRKDYMIRMVQSSTGEKPLYLAYDAAGEPMKKYVASYAPLEAA